MAASRLAIPLKDNPARQNLWRAVGLCAGLLGAIMLGLLVDRAWHIRALPQRWPETAELEIRLIKTRQLSAYAEHLAGVQVLPGAPWDIATLIEWSNKELVIYADADTPIAVVIDGDLPTDIANSLPNWGLTSVAIGHRTMLVAVSDAKLAALERHGNLFLLWPMFNGSLSIKGADDVQTLPFNLDPQREYIQLPIKMTEFIADRPLSLPENVELLANLRLPAELSQAFVPGTVSGAFPGIDLLAQASGEPITLLLGQDANGLAFNLGLASPNYSLEQLGAIASELASLQRLSTAVLTNDTLPSSSEIRGSSQVEVTVSQDGDLKLATASFKEGGLYRLSQTTASLLLSNRPPLIGLSSAKYTGECLHRPAAFIKPTALAELLPGSTEPSTGLVGYLLAADTIAVRANKVRICW